MTCGTTKLWLYGENGGDYSESEWLDYEAPVEVPETRCPVCGDSFTINTELDPYRQKFCSEKCFTTAVSWQSQYRLGGSIIHERKSKTVTCEICGREFKGLLLSKKKNLYQKYCCDDCYRIAERRRRHGNQDYGTIYNRECPICGREFTTVRSYQKFCSMVCQRLKWKGKKREIRKHNREMAKYFNIGGIK